MLVLLIFYILAASCLPILSHRATLALHFAHASAWCILHTFGLGLLLQAQSKSKFLVRHFLKNYAYPVNDNGDGAVQEAFTNWKSLYNMSLCMTYSMCLVFSSLFSCLYSFVVSLAGLAWKTYEFPRSWTEGDDLLCHTLGAVCRLVLPVLYFSLIPESC